MSGEGAGWVRKWWKGKRQRPWTGLTARRLVSVPFLSGMVGKLRQMEGGDMPCHSEGGTQTPVPAGL